MSQINPRSQMPYWETAGAIGYEQQYYASPEVGAALQARLQCMAIDLADALATPSAGRVLDIGCGDGAFANRVLAARFSNVTGIDFSSASIDRARQKAAANASFDTFDLTSRDVAEVGQCDAAFLIGTLHHVKARAPLIAMSLAKIAPRVVVIEPNGNHIMRKLLEFTPSYRAAGEDSFRRSQIPAMFEAAGYRTAANQRFNLFPNFTPRAIYRLLAPLGPLVENSPLATLNAYAFILR